MINALKIKKLKKLKQNTYYAWCKKDYQKLNHIGKKEFQDFKVYAKAFQRQYGLNKNYKFKTYYKGGVSNNRYYNFSAGKPTAFKRGMKAFRKYF